MAASTRLSTKPMSVKEIVQKAQEFDFNPHIALKYWLRTADTLLREAQIYESEDNDQQAYLLLIRYATLVTDKLSQHPAAREPEGRKVLKAALSNIPEVLDRLEALKPAIEARYESWHSALAQPQGAYALDVSGAGSHFEESDPAIAGNTATLGAAENEDLAVRLAHTEIRRRAATRKGAHKLGLSEDEERERRTAGLWDDWEAALSQDRKDADDDDMRLQIAATRRRMDDSYDGALQARLKRQSEPRHRSRPMIAAKTHTDYQYPSVLRSEPLNYQRPQFDSQMLPIRDTLPPRPVKEGRNEVNPLQSAIPTRPSKEPLQAPHSGPRPPTPPPPYDEAPSYTFRPSAYLENGSPLRTVFLPPTLRERFLHIAAANTRKNLETCGILCGTLISNALFISRLVIPEQECTSDTCEMLNESALFDFCDSEDLMVLGWIHTHPMQTCFLSSRDLHTHCGYQVMMPESIAIVCAPSKQPSWGVFRLTDPPGMKSVLNCRQTGLFHPHPESNIYTDALRPGHVFEAKGLEFQIVDLRPGF
ncbi:MAG: hypothetical protein M1818_003040 [Claussenomyces sp. TS43310]|nr:MAG: hypothetical protein M1818_003040 [Claussenomyces sp. TS43310]